MINHSNLPKSEEKEAFARLLNIMDDLRKHCPWDKKQTLSSLRHLTLEEVYELSDAIINEDDKELSKELGDLLLHIVFYAKIGEERTSFTMVSVLNGICEKLIHRHPHIYSDVEVSNEEDVKRNWEKLKLKEGKKSVLEGVPNAMPALVKAYRIQEKVKGVGFEFENSDDTWAKVEEELHEFKSAKSNKERELEFGDLLFSLVNYARYTGINPEDALEKTNRKFKNRFQQIEDLARKEGKRIEDLNLAEQDTLWEQAKLLE